MSSLLLVLVPY